MTETNHIAVSETEGVIVVQLTGEHDVTTAPELSRRLAELVRTGKGLVVDLTRAAFVDSTVLNLVIRTDRELADGGRRLVVQLDPESVVARVFEVSGLRGHIAQAADREQAVALAASRSTSEA